MTLLALHLVQEAQEVLRQSHAPLSSSPQEAASQADDSVLVKANGGRPDVFGDVGDLEIPTPSFLEKVSGVRTEAVGSSEIHILSLPRQVRDCSGNSP